MGKYIVKRILQVIPMLFILSLIVFMMVRLIPGDPVDMMLGMDIPKDTKEYERERLGLNDPLYIQYFRFVGNALHGDLGTSIFSGKPVVLFATSGGSGMGETLKKLAPSCPNAKLIEGKVFRRSTGREQLAAWAEGLDL